MGSGWGRGVRAVGGWAFGAGVVAGHVGCSRAGACLRALPALPALLCNGMPAIGGHTRNPHPEPPPAAPQPACVPGFPQEQLHKQRGDVDLVDTPWVASKEDLPSGQYTWEPPAGPKGEPSDELRHRKAGRGERFVREDGASVTRKLTD